MTSLVGQTVGNYRIESLIGRGGMGQVFRGVHVHLGRPVAIKVLHAALAEEPGFQERFLQEARAGAALKHANIVDIYDFGNQAESFYLVMELVTGGSLRGLLSQRAEAGEKPTLWSRVNLVRQAAIGLAAAHARAMVHRDIKPDNLLLSVTETGAYVLKITDFGLVRLAESGVKTISGMTLGTPAYMSPEQCRGVEVDARSDLYSLGVVLYEVATGRLPFEASTLSAAVHSHVYVSPVPPREVWSELPISVERIILRCLAKNPADRFASAAELSVAIEAAIKGSTPAAMAPATVVGSPVGLPQPEVIGTMIQVPGAHRQPPGYSSVSGARPAGGGVADGPRISVQDENGRPVQTIELTRRGITIGRAAGSDVRLESQEVSGHHARADWDGERVTVIDLGSNNGTFLGDSRLLPQVPQAWDGRQLLAIGPFWLRVEQTTREIVAEHPVVPAGPRSVIGVALDRKEIALTPGQPSPCKVTLENLGTRVDWVRLVVEGVPEEWVQGTGREEQLNPEHQAIVVLTINVPRVSASRAGEYPVTIRARSRNAPDESGTAAARWTVLPFEAMSLAIAPGKATGRTGATYKISVRNDGNARGNYVVDSTDDQETLTHQVEVGGQPRGASASLQVEAGEAPIIRLKVGAARRWIGTARSHSVSVRAVPDGRPESQRAPAQFVHLAVFPPWFMAMAAVVLLALGVLLTPLMQPVISVVDVNPPKPVTGKPVTLSWEVKRARDVRFEVEGRPMEPKAGVAAGQYVIPFERGLQNDTNVKVTASSMLGMLGRPAERVDQIHVEQPSPVEPVIEKFEASPPSVMKGASVRIQWKVTNAVRGVELEGFGPRKAEDAIQDKPQQVPYTAYKLIAKGAGGLKAEMTLNVAVQEKSADPAPVVRLPVIEDFSVVPGQVRRGERVAIQWKVRDADRVEIEGRGQVNKEKGQTDELPQETREYKLVARNSAGKEVTETRKVVVIAPLPPVAAPVIEQFSVTPPQVAGGGRVVIEWKVRGADGVEINGRPVNKGEGRIVLVPRESEEYKLVARNSAGKEVTETRKVELIGSAGREGPRRVVVPAPDVGSRWTIVPDVRGLTPQDAQRRLAAVGLEAEVSRRPVYSDAYQRGTVMDQRPAAGGRVEQGGRVELLVSLGARPTR